MQRNFLTITATLCGAAIASTLDQNTTHGLGSDAEEVRTVAWMHSVVVDEAQIRLVYQGSGLKTVTGSLPLHLAMGQSPKFLVDQRDHTVQRCFVAVAPTDEQVGNVLCRNSHS